MPLHVVSSTGTVAGKAQLVVPDVSGDTEGEAKLTLADFTVRVRTVETPGQAGTVFAQDPAGGSVRPRRSPITIFLIVNPAPDNDDLVGALNDLTAAVDTLAGTVGTEQAAKDRHDVVLQRLDEIKDGLSGVYGGSGTSTGRTSKPTTTTS